MKRVGLFLFTLALLSLSSTSLAVEKKQIHEQARFIADKIAYQFGLDKDQLTDAYEINYDFLQAVYALQDRLIAGDEKAITEYYILLDIRNSDLVWIMDHARYANFLDVEEQFRPVYIKDGELKLRMYDVYGKNKFFEGKPKRFGKYDGDHSRSKNNNESFYKGKHKFVYYGGQPRLLDNRNKVKLGWARKADFGK